MIGLLGLGHSYISGNYVRSFYDFAALLMLDFYRKYDRYKDNTFRPISFPLITHNINLKKISKPIYRLFPPHKAVALINSTTTEIYFNNIVNCNHILINNNNTVPVTDLCYKEIKIPKQSYLYFPEINKNPLPKNIDLFTKTRINKNKELGSITVTSDNVKLPNCRFAVVESEIQLLKAIAHKVVPVVADHLNVMNLSTFNVEYLPSDYPIRIGTYKDLEEIIKSTKKIHYDFNIMKDYFEPISKLKGSLETELLAFCRKDFTKEDATTWYNKRDSFNAK